ncbi:DegT/DnrJ/EryC1/StrS family aminotransferase [Acinetobacter lwoffii]|uniref:DegT/DnrJ/EryC1/StrS family aminotransferase n=1 Tax=Acinetobacter lwoffii TaxID=28090 RepID=UPI001FB32411|nr:DegT/DnrJ/EryC1/StrS family aminotransferase [Acinetobacter lwoffii]MCJ0926548.1 DegT/DnrJ/EryC1/StrS family aminotransferase [Acinetobacter lwoffii]
MIPVTRSYLPNKEKFKAYIDQIYDSGWLTNRGNLLLELERRLSAYLGVKHLILVANGSLALQVAYKALNLKGEVITTPFSFAATTNTLVWEGLNPIFVDIDPHSFNLNPTNIEQLITTKTSAIVPVHVFGNPCEVEAIQIIANKHNLKVIYDAAHAFGSQYKGQSVLNYGDISTLSFHATKLFHTIEGGAVITNDNELAKKIRLLINFGITGPTSIESIGINAKMNEFEAAMGLCVLDEIETINAGRKQVWQTYQESLQDKIVFQQWNKHSQNNYAYAPVLFKSEAELLKVEAKLKENDIVPRRYFYPSLDTLDYLASGQICKYSRDRASRVLCLPMFPSLEKNSQDKICEILSNTL